MNTILKDNKYISYSKNDEENIVNIIFGSEKKR